MQLDTKFRMKRLYADPTVITYGSKSLALSLPWEAIGTPAPRNGMIWIYRTGTEQPLLTVPLRYPNAALIPALFAAFRP